MKGGRRNIASASFLLDICLIKLYNKCISNRKVTSMRCYYCDKEINEADQQTSKSVTNARGGTSFAHYDCAKIGDLARELIDGFNIVLFRKQFKRYINEGISKEDLANCIRYIYDVKDLNDPEQSHGGIGLVRYNIEESRKYYQKKEERKKTLDEVPDDVIEKYKRLYNASLAVKENKSLKLKRPLRSKYFDSVSKIGE